MRRQKGPNFPSSGGTSPVSLSERGTYERRDRGPDLPWRVPGCACTSMKALLVDAFNLNGASFPERGQTVTVSFSRDDLIALDHQSRLNSHSPTILSACREGPLYVDCVEKPVLFAAA
jgi:hypothetical protein